MSFSRVVGVCLQQSHISLLISLAMIFFCLDLPVARPLWGVCLCAGLQCQGSLKRRAVSPVTLSARSCPVASPHQQGKLFCLQTIHRLFEKGQRKAGCVVPLPLKRLEMDVIKPAVIQCHHCFYQLAVFINLLFLTYLDLFDFYFNYL